MPAGIAQYFLSVIMKSPARWPSDFTDNHRTSYGSYWASFMTAFSSFST